MTGLGRSVAKFNKKTFGKTRDPLAKKIDDVADSTHFAPRLKPADEGPVIPLPDEEALSLAKRRARSRRRGARAATVLSGGDDDTLG